jgi:hypothetical protein
VRGFASLDWSYEVGLPYLINQLDWYLFGPALDIYSFRNLVLPRLVAGMVCTMPPVIGAYWWHSRPRES